MFAEHWVVSFCGLLVSGFIVSITVARILRRRRQWLERSNEHFDFSVDELTRLLAAGQITREEYQRLKERTLARRTPPPDQRHIGFEVLPPRDHF